jgi:pimeloyl-ACP methyl ester carboxylesterase
MPATEVRIPSGRKTLGGTLEAAGDGTALVLFAHGSGSGRHSPRNQYVAGVLHEAGIGTLLFDLLTPEEEEIDRVTAHLRFDVDMLGERLVDATLWVRASASMGEVPAIGYFGASTGAAAALIAAARLSEVIGAVVSRGGRPDLAGAALGHVTAPTLLIVGALDTVVIELNEAAYERLRCEKELALVPGASHLFEEPGTLAQAAGLAAEWFSRYLLGEARARLHSGDAVRPRP